MNYGLPAASSAAIAAVLSSTLKVTCRPLVNVSRIAVPDRNESFKPVKGDHQIPNIWSQGEISTGSARSICSSDQWKRGNPKTPNRTETPVGPIVDRRLDDVSTLLTTNTTR